MFSNPYDVLHIYYLSGRLETGSETFGSDYLGNWEEEDSSFLFFSRPAAEQIEGLLAAQPIEIESGSLMDMLADRMQKTLAYKPGERDMLLMRHDITFEYDGGQRKERITAIMVDFGIPNGDSSMARTVSLPAAIGTRMLLEDKIRLRGVQIPIVADIYNPVLDELERLGIGFKETREKL